MSEHRDEKWLDEQLRKAVDGVSPTFDAQAWKQRYANEYEALLARGKQAGCGWPRRMTRLLIGPFGKLALAAVVLVLAGVLLVEQVGFTPDQPGVAPPGRVQESPAQMISMISLSAAFRRGGLEGLDRQCDQALKTLGPRPNSVSMQDLLKDLNSKG